MSHQADAGRYSRMPYHRCGRSGLLLPAVSLGLYQNFTDNDPFDTCRAIVCRAFDLGVTHFDLANNYGSPAGSSESILGRILRWELSSHRDEIIVSTKAGYDMWPGPYGEWGSRKYMLASLDQSLARLGLAYVDLFYSHRYDPETPLEETMGALASAVQQGKALYVGISNYPASAASEAFRILRSLGVPCVAHQLSYSLLNRGIEKEHLPLHAREGVGTVIFQALQRGILSDSYIGELSEARKARLKAWVVPESWLAKLPRLREIAQTRGQSLSEMALVWSLREGRVATALVGASSVAQLDVSLAALSKRDFSADELSRIDAVLS